MGITNIVLGIKCDENFGILILKNCLGKINIVFWVMNIEDDWVKEGKLFCNNLYWWVCLYLIILNVVIFFIEEFKRV